MDDFIRPTLLVGLFKPPEELSAAVVMELLYYYALAHQTSFDVRWIANKSINEKIISPLAMMLKSKYADDFNVIGNGRVEKIHFNEASQQVTGVDYQRLDTGETVSIEDITASVLAVGAKGMKSIMAKSPALAFASPELSKASSLNSIDVIACRFWLDRNVTTRSPANVFARFPELRGAGGTFFMLDQLQGNMPELWGGEEPQGSVVSCDFYNAGALLPLSPESIRDILMEKLLPAAVPGFRDAKVLDFYVQKYPGAVSWFSPGSFASRPPVILPGNRLLMSYSTQLLLMDCINPAGIRNLCCAGDWVRMGDREHGAKGLCQERAFVSGIEAANSLARTGALGRSNTFEKKIVPIRDDELQVKLGRNLNKNVMSLLRPLKLDSPWVR